MQNGLWYSTKRIASRRRVSVASIKLVFCQIYVWFSIENIFPQFFPLVALPPVVRVKESWSVLVAKKRVRKRKKKKSCSVIFSLTNFHINLMDIKGSAEGFFLRVLMWLHNLTTGWKRRIIVESFFVIVINVPCVSYFSSASLCFLVESHWENWKLLSWV